MQRIFKRHQNIPNNVINCETGHFLFRAHCQKPHSQLNQKYHRKTTELEATKHSNK